MIKDNRNNEQIYGRNDMIMLDPNNKIYGSLGIADNYVMKTEEGTRLVLNNPKQGRFGDVLTEFNMYGRSEQKQYKGINLFPPDTKSREYVEVSIPKGSLVFWITDGTPTNGGNFRFFNEDKTENMWLGIDSGTTSKRMSLTIDAKYVQNLITTDFDLSKICLGIGSEPIYEPYTGGIPSPSPDYPQEIKSVVNPTVKVTNEDGLKVQSVTFNNITLNAIPVASGGNVTIDGQQYIADYVDVECGKVIRNILKWYLADNIELGFNNDMKWHMNISGLGIDGSKEGLSNMVKIQNNHYNGVTISEFHIDFTGKFAALNMRGMTDEEFKKWIIEKNPEVYNVLTVAEEIPITPEEASAFKQLMTYYPVTIVENNYNTWMRATYKSIESA